jgi:hypothetical protein
MDLLNPIKLAFIWHREFRKVRAELESYSARELAADLRMSRADIPEVAARAADEKVAALVRRRPERRLAWWWRGRQAAALGCAD